MSNLSWKDVSSWSQGTTEEERKTPTAWELRYGSLRIQVHHHVGSGKAWFVTCNEVCGMTNLGTEDPDVAKKAAIRHVHDAVDELYCDAEIIYNTLG